MTKGFIITGTDTDVGKTVCAAMLTLALGGVYWKPAQSGTEEGTDTQTIKELCGDHTLPETYVFSNPLSPHRAAELDGVEIDSDVLALPQTNKTLIIEGAGGLLVPLTRDTLFIEVFKKWSLPVILCARTGLGTINHTLLSVEALRARDIPIHGISFIGEDNPDNIRTIHEFSGVRVLGHIPMLNPLNAQALQSIFEQNFNREDFDDGQQTQNAA